MEPHTESTPIRLVQITDTHFYAEPGGLLGGIDVDRALAAVVDSIEGDPAWQPQAIVVTGDLVQEETTAAYHRLAQLVSALPAPSYCLPGNHDDKTLLAECCATSELRWEGFLKLGDWLLVFLDSVRPGDAGGHVAPSELDRLAVLLAERPEPHHLLLVHHQPVAIESPWLDTMMIDNASELFAVLDRDPALRGIVFGHIHQSFATQRRGVPIWGTPSTCLQFTPRASSSSYDRLPPGYRWLELGADGSVTTGVRRVVPRAWMVPS